MKGKTILRILSLVLLVFSLFWFYACSGDDGDDDGGKEKPTLTDTDGDRVPDNQDAFPNNPNEQYDTDQDGIGDNYENQYGLDPNNDDADQDPDQDGLTNLDEFQIGTQANNPDSDNDGLMDEEEIQLGTDPLKQDTDGDGDIDREDCAPKDSNISHNAQEGPPGDLTCADGKDNDCDGAIDLDDNNCVACQFNSDCDDGNQCTEDICISGICENNPLSGGSCDDGLYCTVNDYCDNGVCKGGGLMDCNDDNVCTDDACDENLDRCVHTNNNEPCDDGLFCNGTDTCSGGSCSVHSGNPCPPSAPYCIEATDQCVSVACFNDSDCDDGNPCTDDICQNPGTDSANCINTNDDSNSCNDGKWCTINDRCSSGSCIGDPRNCNDGNECTDDICNENLDRCDHPYNNNSCNDGLWCTINDRCQNGACTGEQRDCSDSYSCTIDTCNESLDRCEHSPPSGGCMPGQNRNCGDCGTQTCTSSCTWGSCTCSTQTQSQPCGNCGSGQKTRTCSQSTGCVWSSWSSCSGPGCGTQTEQRSCGDCGTQTRTCQSNCTWGSWSSCSCSYQSRSCGNCGTQYCSQSTGCNWSPCQGEGPCSPGKRDTQNCGDCGTRTRTCQSDCNWGSWSSCSCSTQTDTQGCGCDNVGSQSRSCSLSTSCYWGSWSSCSCDDCTEFEAWGDWCCYSISDCECFPAEGNDTCIDQYGDDHIHKPDDVDGFWFSDVVDTWDCLEEFSFYLTPPSGQDYDLEVYIYDEFGSLWWNYTCAAGDDIGGGCGSYAAGDSTEHVDIDLTSWPSDGDVDIEIIIIPYNSYSCTEKYYLEVHL